MEIDNLEKQIYLLVVSVLNEQLPMSDRLTFDRLTIYEKVEQALFNVLQETLAQHKAGLHFLKLGIGKGGDL